MAVFN